MKKTLLIGIFLWSTAYVNAQIGSKIQAGKASLKGTWINSEFGYTMKLEFDSDSSGAFDGDKFKYSIQGSVLTMRSSFETTSYQYTLNNNVLILSGGDLESAISFQLSPVKEQTSNQDYNTAPPQASIPASQKKSNTDLIGTWVGNNETLQFNADKTCNYQGINMKYELNADKIIITGEGGSSVLNYSIQANRLTLSGNGTTVILEKITSTPGNPATPTPEITLNNSAGEIDQSLVGKWCYMSTLTSQNASSSYSRCIVINANGTYEYHAEGSISGYGGGYYGGSSSQSADKGTWRLSGNKLYVQSEKEGSKIYTLEKKNHPKNNDPMIVIDGENYVTYFQKSPW